MYNYNKAHWNCDIILLYVHKSHLQSMVVTAYHVLEIDNQRMGKNVFSLSIVSVDSNYL